MTERDSFARDYNVPRGTMDKFDRYAAMLADWQSRMNLVGPSTLPDVWTRHFGDSAQLMAPSQLSEGAWVDLGSGAGFPGLVVALLGRKDVHLVEATAKKCRFLQAVADELGIAAHVRIHNSRVEAMAPFPAAVISARALANLGQLFEWGLRFSTPGSRWLLLKGESASDEIATARKDFNFDVNLVESSTNPRGRIIIAGKVRRRAS